LLHQKLTYLPLVVLYIPTDTQATHKSWGAQMTGLTVPAKLRLVRTGLTFRNRLGHGRPPDIHASPATSTVPATGSRPRRLRNSALNNRSSKDTAPAKQHRSTPARRVVHFRFLILAHYSVPIDTRQSSHSRTRIRALLEEFHFAPPTELLTPAKPLDNAVSHTPEALSCAEIGPRTGPTTIARGHIRTEPERRETA
jgi:hypothetical protein